jgi:hypothetical protein
LFCGSVWVELRFFSHKGLDGGGYTDSYTWPTLIKLFISFIGMYFCDFSKGTDGRVVFSGWNFPGEGGKNLRAKF